MDSVHRVSEYDHCVPVIGHEELEQLKRFRGEVALDVVLLELPGNDEVWQESLGVLVTQDAVGGGERPVHVVHLEVRHAEQARLEQPHLGQDLRIVA